MSDVKSKIINFLTGFCILIVSVSVAAIIAFNSGKKQGRRIAVDFNNIEMLLEVDTYEPHYKFLPKLVDMYICKMCEELNLDSDRAIAHLMVENPEFDPQAVSKPNENGTLDLGLWQLNDRYLWTTFMNRYWFDNIQLNPFNWKHNTYIALHHMKYLEDKLKIEDDAIMAYNCGEGNVMNGTIPDSTLVYLAKVKNNLFLLKGSTND